MEILKKVVQVLTVKKIVQEDFENTDIGYFTLPKGSMIIGRVIIKALLQLDLHYGNSSQFSLNQLFPLQPVKATDEINPTNIVGVSSTKEWLQYLMNLREDNKILLNGMRVYGKEETSLHIEDNTFDRSSQSPGQVNISCKLFYDNNSALFKSLKGDNNKYYSIQILDRVDPLEKATSYNNDGWIETIIDDGYNKTVSLYDGTNSDVAKVRIKNYIYNPLNQTPPVVELSQEYNCLVYRKS